MSEWQRKLDAYSRRALQASEGEGGLDITVRLTDGDRSGVRALAESGLEVQTTLGDLVVGRVADRAALIRIAELPCVAEVQASRPLHNEPR
ncbi:MAG TPA: hypothetical protein VEO74_06860 [Thermoanaerobaculia bacterium]|nr:hypothetical protein [Thermoanaerobaculia bacterium]